MRRDASVRPVTRRRAILVVPAAPAAKLVKGRSLEADEVVIDLEDAVVPAAKEEARSAVAAALGEEFAAPSVAVRVNAIGTPWCHLDLIAVAGSAREQVTVVLPKVESAGDLAFADRLLAGAEAAAGREAPVRLLALIETAAGLQAVAEIAAASARLDGLIIGYADLAASLGRAGAAPGDWGFAQHAVLVAARAAGIQAIDGPYGRVGDDAGLRERARLARALGLDGKWTIHPGQIAIVNEVFSPEREQWERAEAMLTAYREAHAAGSGAAVFEGEMIDEANRKMAERLAGAGRAAGYAERG
jgi:citrate lyase subunit beta/citryl-CoA lyase